MANQRQKKAIANLVETGGSVSAAMRKAGYSPKTAKTPKKLTESKAWEKILGKSLPDELLMERHRDLLNKQEVRIKNNVSTGEIDTIPTGEIDIIAVSKGLDMAYKLKGKYAPDKVAFTDKAGEDILSLEEKEALLKLIQ